MQPTTQQIEDLRTNFLKKLNEEGGELSIHPLDLERVKSSDDWLKRFLLHHDLDQTEALKMMLETCEWRKKFGTNEISESTVRMEYLVDGAFFSHAKDVDGYTLFIFKCKKHVKGQKDIEEIKRCVVYWFERLEREVKGNPITIFFDMEGCGLANMDMEFTKYLIGLFKQYYPYFLNYIIIYEMAWILNAAFKIIKTWLPEKAVQKIKFVNKSNLSEFVKPDQALKCWGGQNDYIFSFIPETRISTVPSTISTSNKKVHFADGSPMSETAGGFGDRDADDVLSIFPPSCITFIKDGEELSSVVMLSNTDEHISISYKMKTTAPEKFRVRPSAGCLAPGGQASINVTLLPGYQLGGLSRDKFLLMSVQVDSADLTPQELTELWKNTAGKNISQHKLRCAQASADVAKNGSAVGANMSEHNDNTVAMLSSKISHLSSCQNQLHKAVRNVQILQILIIFFIVLQGFALLYMMRNELKENHTIQECYRGV